MRDIQQLIDNEDAIGLAAWVRRGEVQPVELVEAVIERIEQVEPRLNAVAERLYDQAREDALAPTSGKGCSPGCRP